MSLMVVFSLAAVVTFNLALQGNLAAVREVSVGLLWVTILLAGTLGLNRSFSAEQENRSFEALLLAPISRTALYVGKVISISLFTLTLELILLVVFTAFTNKPFWLPQVCGLLALGTAGYVMAGVLVTSMSIQTRAREVLLPVLLLPLTLPVVLSAASATAAYVENPATPWSVVSFQVSLVLFYDVLIFCAGWFTYPAVVEE
jgi:heme exporter protein B